MPSHRESRVTTAGKWLLAFVVPASALALGSLLTEALAVMAALAAVACALLWFEPPRRTTPSSRLILIGLVILLGATVLQAIPLPAGAVRALAPSNADVWDRALAPFHEPSPAWHTISLAPAATHEAILRGVFYVCIFLGALRIAALEGGTTFLERLVVASACVMAITALGHAATSASRVFGIYKPREAYAYIVGHYGPLLNKNHLASYVGLGACVALGTVVTKRAIPRTLGASAVLLLGGTCVWTASRGGTAALLIGAALTIGVAIRAKRGIGNVRAETVILGICVLAGAAMLGLGLSNIASSKFASGDFGKFAVIKNALHLVPESPWFGVGRGAFETVFPAIREGTVYMTYTHPEDIVAQWAIEWGLPVSIAAFSAFALALRPKTVLLAARPSAGAWAAIVATVLADLVDFHLEVPGIVALVLVCMAIVTGGRAASSEERAKAGSQRAVRFAAWAAAFAMVPAVIWVIPDVSHSLAEERSALSAIALDRRVSREAFRGALRDAMLRYPAEPFFPLMGATRAQVTGEESVVPWVARALERNPRFGRAHLVLARSLASSRRRAQARLEYRLAYETDAYLRGTIVPEAKRLVDDTDSALELVPSGPEGEEMLEGLVDALGGRLPATATQLDDELTRRAPRALGPLRRRVDAALADLRDNAPWCADRAACLRDALAATQSWVAREPEQCRSHVALARLRVESGDTALAFSGLEEAEDRALDPSHCERELINLAVEAKQNARVDAALARLGRRGCGRTVDCVELYTWSAAVEEQRKHYASALTLYRRASEIAPERDDILANIGRLGASAGMLSEAADAYTTLASRHPEDPQWPAKLAEVHSQVAQRRAPLP